jgi:hypothetical protein
MRLNLNKYLAITVTLLCFSNVSFASSVVSCGSGTYDYGDATVSIDGTTYGEACHDTNRWQQLGTSDGGELEGDTGDTSDADNENNGWTGEKSNESVDSGDNGVSWKVQNIDGTWPSTFNSGELTPGAKVEFQFVVTRSNEGNHKFDQLKAWTDWNGDGVFDESESIIDKKWMKNRDSNNVKNGNGSSNTDLNTNNNTDTQRIYTTNFTVPSNAVIGDTWMRARVICENSLTTYDRNNRIFHATGYYHQGEVEDYKVAINSKAGDGPTPVPEPTTLLVFGSALIGLVLSRKKTK